MPAISVKPEHCTDGTAQEELKDASLHLPRAMMIATFFNGILGEFFIASVEMELCLLLPGIVMMITFWYDTLFNLYILPAA